MYKILGISLLIIAIAGIAGFFLKNTLYWFVFDIATITVAGFSGLMMMIKEKNE